MKEFQQTARQFEENGIPTLTNLISKTISLINQNKNSKICFCGLKFANQGHAIVFTGLIHRKESVSIIRSSVFDGEWLTATQLKQKFRERAKYDVNN